MKTVSLISTSVHVSKALAVALVLSLVAAGSACAQDKAVAANPVAEKIAVVDLAYLVAESKAGKSIGNQLDTQRKAYANQIMAKEKAFKAESQTLEAQKGKLSKEEFEKKVIAFREKAQTAGKEVSKRQIAFKKAYVTALEKLREEIVKIVAGISSKKGIALVLNRQEVVLVDSKMDITKEVLGQLDAKVTSIPVNIK